MATTPEINRRELLIVLEYLFRYTDETHYATRISICEFARRKYGLKFDKNNGKDNEIRRTRISDCLEYLYKLQDKETVELPFILEKTEGNKYYIERQYFTEEELVKVCASLMDSKYIDEKEGRYLSQALVDYFSTIYNKKELQQKTDGLIKSNDK